MEEQPKKKRIGRGMAFLWIFLAAIADGLTFVPLAGDFVAPVFWVVMAVYLWRTKHGFANWKRLVPELVSFVAELIPVVQEFPTILAATLIIIAVSRVEDKTGIKLMPSRKKPGVTPPRNPITPLNNGGVRQPPLLNSAKQNVVAPVPLNQNGTKPDTIGKLHPLQEAEFQKRKENPNMDFAAMAYGKTSKEKYAEYIERGFSEESSRRSARADAEYAANKEKNKIWSESQQRYI